MSDVDDERGASEHDEATEGRVLAVHFGRSANCSSVGSLVDFLYVSSVVGAAVLSAVAVLVARGSKGDGGEGSERGRPEREDARDEGGDP